MLSEHYGRGDLGVFQIAGRVIRQLADDMKLRGKINKIERKLNLSLGGI